MQLWLVVGRLFILSFKQKNHEEKYVEYPIFETWIVPSIIGRKIWNTRDME